MVYRQGYIFCICLLCLYVKNVCLYVKMYLSLCLKTACLYVRKQKRNTLMMDIPFLSRPRVWLYAFVALVRFSLMRAFLPVSLRR